MSWRRLLFVLPVIVVAAIAYAAILHPRVAAAADDTFTTTLYPGWNLIGWTEADAPVERVLETIPKLQSIRSSSQGSAWVVIRANVAGSPARRILEMGRGYWLYVSGHRPVLWSRTFDLDAASRELGSGNQLVAWAGLDGVPLVNAVNGIHAEVRRAWRWDASGQRFQFWRPGGPVAEIASPDPTRRPLRSFAAGGGGFTLRRGEAIGVSVLGPTLWRQPTGALPQMEFLGDVPQFIREQAQADLRWVVEYFGKQFGIEAEASRVRVLVPRTAADLTGRSADRNKPLTASANLPYSLNEEAAIVMPMGEWGPAAVDRSTGESINGRIVMLHEYYHVLQFQLAGSEFHSIPNWLVEGAPSWLQYQLDESHDPGWSDELVASQFVLDDGTIDAPALELPPVLEAGSLYLTESPPHSVGSTFVRWTNTRFGDDAHIRFWQTFRRAEAAGASWQDVMRMAFGANATSIQQEFSAWLRERHPVVSGMVVAPERIDITNLYLNLSNGRTSPLLRIPVASDGSFRVAVPIGSGYRFTLALDDLTCASYAGLDGSLRSFDDAMPFAVESGGRGGIVIHIEDDYCQAIVEGRVSDVGGQGVAGAHVEACETGFRCWVGATDEDGRYRIQLEDDVNVTLSVREDEGSCRLYASEGVAVADAYRATRHLITAGVPAQLDVQVPTPMCGYVIRGELRTASGSNLPTNMRGIKDNPFQLYAFEEASGPRPAIYAEVTESGDFEMAVSNPGQYRLYLRPMYALLGDHEGTCEMESRPVRVPDEGSAHATLTVSSEFCKWRVAGRLVDDAGRPHVGQTVAVCGYYPSETAPRCGASIETDADGRFSLYVPFDGRITVGVTYNTLVWVPDYTLPANRRHEQERCTVWGHSEGRRELVLNGADITNIEIVYPYELCDRILDSVRPTKPEGQG